MFNFSSRGQQNKDQEEFGMKEIEIYSYSTF